MTSCRCAPTARRARSHSSVPHLASQPRRTRRQRVACSQRKGAIILLSAVMMAMLISFVALSVDVGYIAYEKARLQNAADAAALAAATEMHNDQAIAVNQAVSFASQNVPGVDCVLQASEVRFGTWDQDAKVFVVGGNGTNAVQVELKRNRSRSNAVPLFFARTFGSADVEEMRASSVAYAPPPSQLHFQFLLDEEIIDSDEAAIEDLADELNIPSDDLISDLDQDGFIDLPHGSVLTLPTGQVGDEALFDVSSWDGAFPFLGDLTLDFIAYGTALQSELNTIDMENLEWDENDAPHPELEGKKWLDPVPGTDPMDSHSAIYNLPDPNQIYLSPVFKSDVSMAETDPSKYGSPAANLQGERRGLLAYRILNATPHPAGGSYLPMLTIEVVSPEEIDVEDAQVPQTNSEGEPTTSGYIVQ